MGRAVPALRGRGGGLSYLRGVWHVALKDLGAETRSLERVSSMLFLALTILVVFNFAFDFSRWRMEDLASGALWVTLPLASILALHDSFRTEREEQALWALRLTPVDESAIYVGKLMANWLLLVLVACLTLGLCALFFNFDPRRARGLALVVPLSSLGFAALGTLFATLSSRTRRGEVLLHLLLLPLALPLILAAVRSTTPLLLGLGISAAAAWLKLTLAMDLLFVTAGVLLFEYLVEE